MVVGRSARHVLNISENACTALMTKFRFYRKGFASWRSSYSAANAKHGVLRRRRQRTNEVTTQRQQGTPFPTLLQAHIRPSRIIRRCLSPLVLH